MNVYDKLGVERKIGPVSFDDVVVVISEDLTTVNIYYLGFLEEEEGTDAYVLSNVLLVNPLALTITGPIDGLSIGIFMNSIIPAPLATVKVVDEFGVEKTTGTIEAGKDKLVVTSGNGKKIVEYSLLSPVSVKPLANTGINIYPNPSQGEIIIERQEWAGIMNLRIYNITGQVIFMNKYNPAPRNTINLENVKPGIYFLELQIDDQVINRKLLIQ